MGGSEAHAPLDAFAVLSVALSLQNLNPNEATGAHADSILSEVGALALVTQGQRIQGAALISALRTDGDAVVPMHGPR